MQLIKASSFEKKINGKQTSLFTLKNENGLVTQITNFGARVVSLFTPDKNGNFADIVLGYNTIDKYLKTDNIYFGATIGRYGNRIANAQFKIKDTTYTLEANNEKNNLHGGSHSFHTVIWDGNQIAKNKLELSYTSKDGEEGFPGELKTTVLYTLTQDNALKIEYTATTNKSTHVNLTHHSYFNLKDGGKTKCTDHLLQINAKNYTPTDASQIPTGKFEATENTPFNFSILKPIINDINTDHEQIKIGSGYDHNFVLEGSGLRSAALVVEETTGRQMEVITNEPGLQFYSGFHISDNIIGKNNSTYKSTNGFCLETQHFPNTPNQDNFPSTLLKPKEVYNSICIYKFGIKK